MAVPEQYKLYSMDNLIITRFFNTIDIIIMAVEFLIIKK